jgi:hypothetical protein
LRPDVLYDVKRMLLAILTVHCNIIFERKQIEKHHY